MMGNFKIQRADPERIGEEFLSESQAIHWLHKHFEAYH